MSNVNSKTGIGLSPFVGWLLLIVTAILSTPSIAKTLEQNPGYRIEGETVHIDVVETPLGALLDELASKQNALIKWPPSGASVELVTLKFSGSFSEAVQRLLGQTSYMIVEDSTGEAAGVVRVTVFASVPGVKSVSNGFAKGTQSLSLDRQPKPPEPTPLKSYNDGMIISAVTSELKSTAKWVKPPIPKPIKSINTPDGMIVPDLDSGKGNSMYLELGPAEN